MFNVKLDQCIHVDVPDAGENKSKDKKAGIICPNAQHSCRVSFLPLGQEKTKTMEFYVVFVFSCKFLQFFFFLHNNKIV